MNGCGKACKDKIINPSVEDITAVSEVETTKNFIKNTYTGIDIRNKGEITNETGDVSRIGMNMYQSRINDKDFYFNDVPVLPARYPCELRHTVLHGCKTLCQDDLKATFYQVRKSEIHRRKIVSCAFVISHVIKHKYKSHSTVGIV